MKRGDEKVGLDLVICYRERKELPSLGVKSGFLGVTSVKMGSREERAGLDTND